MMCVLVRTLITLIVGVVVFRHNWSGSCSFSNSGAGSISSGSSCNSSNNNSSSLH